jgi:hypothetical protein
VIVFIELFNMELIPYPFCLTCYAVQYNGLESVQVITTVTRLIRLLGLGTWFGSRLGTGYFNEIFLGFSVLIRKY